MNRKGQDKHLIDYTLRIILIRNLWLFLRSSDVRKSQMKINTYDMAHMILTSMSRLILTAPF